MNISAERLLIIGKLIGIHRREMLSLTKSAKWTQAGFCKDICSESTLSKIESGKEIRFLENYIFLANKLGFKCNQLPQVDEALTHLIDKMYVDMEYGYKDKVTISCKKAVKLLSQLKDILYYSDLYDVFYGMVNYVDDDTPLPKNYVKSSLMREKLLPLKLQEILNVFIFTDSYLHDADKAFEKVCKKINLLDSDYVVNQMNLLMYYMVNNNGLKFIELSKKLEMKLLNNKNFIRLFDMYNICLVMMADMDKDEVLNYVNKIEELVKREVLPINKISEYYHNRGSSFYMNHDFENALKCFESALKFDNGDILVTNLLIAGCQSRLEVPIDIEDLNESTLKKYSKFLQSIYAYFKMDSNVPAMEKQKFIMDNIVPDLENNEPLFNDMFRYELNVLVAETTQYKDTYIYDLKSRKALNK